MAWRDIESSVPAAPDQEPPRPRPTAKAIVSPCRPQLLPPRFADCLFTHPAYLAAQSVSEVLLVTRAGPAGRLDTAAFMDCGSRIVHLGRLAIMSRDDVSGFAEALFSQMGAAAVVFEDVEIADGGRPIRRPNRVFRYQSHWSRELTVGAPLISGRQLGQLRRKARRLADHLGLEPEFRLCRTAAGDIERIAGLNRAKIERAGGRYRFDRKQAAALGTTAEAIGWTAGLYAGERLIAGDVILCAGTRAYVDLVGYDPEFEHFSPGMQVHHAALSALAARGCREAELMWGDSRWKPDLGAARRRLATIVVWRDWASVVRPAGQAVAAPFVRRIARAKAKALLARWRG